MNRLKRLFTKPAHADNDLPRWVATGAAVAVTIWGGYTLARKIL